MTFRAARRELARKPPCDGAFQRSLASLYLDVSFKCPASEGTFHPMAQSTSFLPFSALQAGLLSVAFQLGLAVAGAGRKLVGILG